MQARAVNTWRPVFSMEADELAVLVDEDRVAVRVFEYEAGRSAAGFVGLDAYLHTLRFQLSLKFPDVGD